jgi:hypothetical protein
MKSSRDIVAAAFEPCANGDGNFMALMARDRGEPKISFHTWGELRSCLKNGPF